MASADQDDVAQADADTLGLLGVAQRIEVVWDDGLVVLLDPGAEFLGIINPGADPGPGA